MVWKPSVTVAAIVEENGRFLMVEEEAENGVVFNQPAGHLEPNETLIHGMARETLEETAYSVRAESLVGIYRWMPRQPTPPTCASPSRPACWHTIRAAPSTRASCAPSG